MDSYHVWTPTGSEESLLEREEVTGKATEGCEGLVWHTNVTCFDHPAVFTQSSLHRAVFQGL